MSARFVAFGDGAVRAALPAGADARGVFDALRGVAGVVDVIVGERHVAVVFDGTAAPRDDLLARALDAATTQATRTPPREHRIVVRYDGPDLEEVAAHAGMTTREVVALHAGRAYVVERVGFLPGFAYLGAVDPRIAKPRRATPRTRVPAGSVGVAGARTGVYPFASPGGWNVIGTAVEFIAFDVARGATLALGDRVVFEPLP